MTQTTISHEAWQQEAMPDSYDTWSRLTLSGLQKLYESFNEVQLFNQYKSQLNGRSFVEIGAATGELYRYLKNFHPEIAYHGFDISSGCVERAKKKYSAIDINVCQIDLSDMTLKPDVLFARDVVLHQKNPWEFFNQLISIPKEAAILRIRTRDKGATEMNPENSCQWVHKKWVPYMILNIDEVVEAVKKAVPFSVLHVKKHYMQLGGLYGRFLPKECYYPETGTAETALIIMKSDQPVANPEIKIESSVDSNPSYNLLERGIHRFRALTS